MKSAGFPNICYITKRFYLLRTEDFNNFDPGSPYGNHKFIFIMHIFRKICLLIDSTFIWIFMLAVTAAELSYIVTCQICHKKTFMSFFLSHIIH